MDSGRDSAFRVLGQRTFATYFAGNFLSNCGTWFQNIAQAILVYRLTHSSLIVGVTNFSQFAGIIVLAPWAGRAADRFDRRSLIIVTQVVSVVITGTLAILAGFGRASVPVVIALALLLGIANAFVIPALKALVPSLVPPRDLHAALTMDSATFNVSRAIGPVLGALVVAKAGIPWAFAVNCLSYTALVVAIVVIGPQPQARRDGVALRLRDTIGMVRRDRTLAVLFGVVMAVALTADPPNTLGPAFATTIFHRSDSFTGIIVGAFGVGATLAALTAVGRHANPYRWILWMLGAAGLGLIGFATAGSYGVGLVGLILCGYGYLAAQTSATTLIVLRVDDRERGRIMALWSVAFLGTRPLASLTEGALAGPFGPRVAAGVIVVPIVVVAVALVLLNRVGDSVPAP